MWRGHHFIRIVFLVATGVYYVETKSWRGLLFSTGQNNPRVDLILQCNASFAPNTDPNHLRLKLFTRSFETRGYQSNMCSHYQRPLLLQGAKAPLSLRIRDLGCVGLIFFESSWCKLCPCSHGNFRIAQTRGDSALCGYYKARQNVIYRWFRSEYFGLGFPQNRRSTLYNNN